MVSLKSTLVAKLQIIFTIRENFQKFPPNTKFPENLQPYALTLAHSQCPPAIVASARTLGLLCANGHTLTNNLLYR